MAIKAGDKIPSVTVKQLSSDGMQDLATDSVFGGKKVVMFTVVGAFTPTCSAKHLPGFVQNLDKFKEQGIEVACLAGHVRDPSRSSKNSMGCLYQPAALDGIAATNSPASKEKILNHRLQINFSFANFPGRSGA